MAKDSMGRNRGLQAAAMMIVFHGANEERKKYDVEIGGHTAFRGPIGLGVALSSFSQLIRLSNFCPACT